MEHLYHVDENADVMGKVPKEKALEYLLRHLPHIIIIISG